jgi:hypothetical protein
VVFLLGRPVAEAEGVGMRATGACEQHGKQCSLPQARYVMCALIAQAAVFGLQIQNRSPCLCVFRASVSVIDNIAGCAKGIK